MLESIKEYDNLEYHIDIQMWNSGIRVCQDYLEYLGTVAYYAGAKVQYMLYGC